MVQISQSDAQSYTLLCELQPPNDEKSTIFSSFIDRCGAKSYKRCMAHFGQLVRRRRLELDLTQEELAAASRIHRNTINRIERTVESPELVNDSTLSLLATGLRWTVDELLAMAASPAKKIPQQNGSPDRGIPILSSVPCGNGDDGHANYDNGIGHEGYISRAAAGVEDPLAYALRVKGDSMMPLLSDGELVICSPSEVMNKGFEDGKVYAIRYTPDGDSECCIKRVFLVPGEPELVELRPENTRYSPKRVPLEHIIRAARVVKLLKDVL